MYGSIESCKLHRNIVCGLGNQAEEYRQILPPYQKYIVYTIASVAYTPPICEKLRKIPLWS